MRTGIGAVALSVMALLAPVSGPARPVWAATDRSGDNGPGFAPEGDLHPVMPNLYSKRVRLSVSVAKPVDPAKSPAWKDSRTRLEWGIDTGGDGADDWSAVFRYDGSHIVGEIRRASGEPVCDADAFFDGLLYVVEAAYWCIGSPRSLGAYAHLIYWDTNTLSEDRSPDQGYERADYHGVGRGRSGYVMLGRDSAIYPFGEAPTYPGPNAGPAGPLKTGVTAVDLELAPSREGYWVLLSDATVRCYGDTLGCPGFGPPPSLQPGEQAVSLSVDPRGYYGSWIFTSRGRVFASGSVQTYGDLAGTPLNGPIRDSVATPSGKGYYMVGSDGGIFAFGDAKFAGSMGGRPLNRPVESLVPNLEGPGYWLVASDGGIFAFGGAPFRGSMGDKKLNKPVTGMVAFGNGYLMVGEDGGIFNFSDKQFYGSLGDRPPKNPIVVVTALDET